MFICRHPQLPLASSAAPLDTTLPSSEYGLRQSASLMRQASTASRTAPPPHTRAFRHVAAGDIAMLTLADDIFPVVAAPCRSLPGGGSGAWAPGTTRPHVAPPRPAASRLTPPPFYNSKMWPTRAHRVANSRVARGQRIRSAAFGLLHTRGAGGGRSLLRTVLRPRFPANREKNREFGAFRHPSRNRHPGENRCVSWS